MKRIYNMYKEENGVKLLDLKITFENDKFAVDEQVHKIHMKDLSKEEINLKLNELNIDENTKLEIKKGIIGKHIGIFEKKQSSIEDKIAPEHSAKSDAYVTLAERFKELEEHIEKEFQELGDSLDNIFK